MARRRYVQIDGELVEVSPDYVAEPRQAKHAVVGDRHYDGLRAPDVERTDISSRAKHREYMKRNNLTTMDDFSSTWQKAAKEREKVFQGVDPTRREQVARAIHQVANKRRS